jgi:hypothetical protein
VQEERVTAQPDDIDHGAPGPAAKARASEVKRILEAEGEYRGQHRDGHVTARRYDGPDPSEPHYRAWMLHQSGQLSDRQGVTAARLADMWARAHVRGAHTRDGSPDDASAMDRWQALMRGRADAVLLEGLCTGVGPGWRLRQLQAALDALADEWGVDTGVVADGDPAVCRIRAAQARE